jgi:putative ABC transport system substrate-binding protein
LSETDFVEGRNVAIEYRFAENQPNRLPEMIADLTHRRVTVIAALGGLAPALAAKAATTTIPIVFGTGGDPVEAGLVASLNRPGGNLTGFSFLIVELMPKRLGLLQELQPLAARFAVLVNPNSPNAEPVIKGVQAAASTIGRQVEIFNASTDREIETAFADLARKGADGLVVSPDPLFSNRRVQLAALAARYAVPAMYYDRAFAEAGGLMSYGSNIADQYHQAGIYAGRILKGEKPADLPVLQSTKFEFVINLKIARALGLDLPPTLLAIADEVIE